MVATLGKQRCGRCDIHGCGEIWGTVVVGSSGPTGAVDPQRPAARVINRVRILLKTDAGWSASQVAAALDTSPRTVFRTKRRYAEEGLDGVLHDHPQANRYRKLDDRGEAHLIALACSDAPVMSTGPCVCCWNWAWCHRCPTRRSGSGSKKHPQALAEAAMVHPESRRRIRGGHCWTCMPNPTTPIGRWCALTRPPPNCWPRSGSRCLLNRDDRGGRTTSIDAAAPATSS